MGYPGMKSRGREIKGYNERNLGEKKTERRLGIMRQGGAAECYHFTSCIVFNT